MKPHRLRIKVLSPLHIGTGEVYEPTDFFVDSSRKELCILDFERFFEHLSGQEIERFKKLCLEGTLEALVKLYDFMDRSAINLLRQGLDGFVLRRISLCAGFLEHYQRVKNLSEGQLRKEFNKFTIQRTAFSPNENTPIIPGSAVKGALRTALLNKRRNNLRGRSLRDYCRQQNPRRPPKCDSKRLESDILQYQKFHFHEDPLRLLKVSDFKPVGEAKTRIVYAVNRKKDGGLARGPYQILEVIEQEAIFEGEISFLPKNRYVKNPVTLEEIKEALKSFYAKEKDREFEEVSQIGGNFPVFPKGAFPIRLGRHSGAECVTIEGFRCILIRGKRGQKPDFKDHATTLWLASEFYNVKNTYSLKPFGWAVLYEAEEEPQISSRAAKTIPTKTKSETVDVTKLAKNPRFKIRVKK